MERSVFLASAVGALASAPTDLDALERRSGGRLGVFAIDTGNGRTLEHRAHERFPMCSTFKLLAVGAVLARIDERNEDLGRRVGFAQRDMLDNSPVTQANLALSSMTIAQLCEAAMVQSDNTAANLLLHSLLGPAGVTRFARKLGDPVTRLDRDEPDVNSSIPGDPRDTTSPAAMASDARALVLGKALSPRLRARLTAWMRACETGRSALRAGLPATWVSGDKTGSGPHGTSNDVAVIWPPQGAPIVVAAYATGLRGSSAAAHTAVLASVGRIVFQEYRPAH
jgi:beta-lactamase class A